jgi:DNA-binding LacI/PurR family transcriptional regulator
VSRKKAAPEKRKNADKSNAKVIVKVSLASGKGRQTMTQRKSGHVTLMDIARTCGFSVSTVSIVLSEAPLSRNVAETTRNLIKVTAQQLGYHPDAYARSLRLRRSQMVGILAYDLSDLYCLPIVRGIQKALQPAGYLPLLMDASTRRALFDSYLQMALERRAEGMIIIGNWVFDETNLLSEVEKNNVPIVIVSRDLTANGVSSVLVDNEAGGALALRHLYTLGHRRIAVIRGPDEMFDSAPRWTGVERAAAQSGIRIDPGLVHKLPNLVDPMSGFEGGRDCARRLQASGFEFTAVIAVDDLTALGVVRGLSEAGVRVPHDCSVVGFDNLLPATVATPGITTIRQPLADMGLLAARWVVKAIDARYQKKPQAPQLHLAPPQLVVRASTTKRPL